MSSSTVAPVANNTGAAALSSVGVGSGLDVNSIVSKLMQVESLPLTQLNSQVTSYQATLSAYGTVNSALGTFQTAVQTLNSSSMFSALSVTPGNSSILTGTATGTAIAGSYNVNVTQLAQAQSLTTAGQASTSGAIGSGAATTISFQFGTISANLAGATLAAGVASGGIAAGSLTLNGTAISTDASTTSASALATQINLETGTTGVTAAVSNGGVTLTSASPITVAGSAPSAAGFTAGSTLASGAYNNSLFTQDPSIAGGTVSIDSTNNSLQGITNAINSAHLGVTATIINDGSSTPNRLVLTSNATGATSSMKISVSGDSTLSSLLSNDPAATQNLTQSVNAQSTSLTVNGIPITSESNTISGAIQGVTLDVSTIGATSVAVAQNSSSVQAAVSSLVSAYNSLNGLLNSATAFNASTKAAGPLIGDSGIQTIQSQLRQLLGTPVAGASQNLNSIGQLGITFQSDGSLALNTTTLQTAITNNYSSVGALFSAIGTASDGLVGFKTSTAATKPGTYAVDITQVASQGTEVGSAAPGLTITSGSNDQLSLIIDGVNSSVNLPAGTYTAASLAAEVQTVINGSTAIANAGSAVNVTVNSSGALAITSKRFGSASTVSLGGDALGTLLGSAPTSTTGLDVAGTIGGNLATGSGQVLTASSGGPTEGLALTINGGTTGSRGTLTFSQGYAYQLNNLLTSFLGSSGPLTVESNGLNNNITGINTQIAELNVTLAAQRANYLAEFTALDTTMSSMNATQTFLTQQLASLASNSGG